MSSPPTRGVARHLEDVTNAVRRSWHYPRHLPPPPRQPQPSRLERWAGVAGLAATVAALVVFGVLLVATFAPMLPPVSWW